MNEQLFYTSMLSLGKLTQSNEHIYSFRKYICCSMWLSQTFAQTSTNTHKHTTHQNSSFCNRHSVCWIERRKKHQRKQLVQHKHRHTKMDTHRQKTTSPKLPQLSAAFLRKWEGFGWLDLRTGKMGSKPSNSFNPNSIQLLDVIPIHLSCQLRVGKPLEEEHCPRSVRSVSLLYIYIYIAKPPSTEFSFNTHDCVKVRQV